MTSSTITQDSRSAGSSGACGFSSARRSPPFERRPSYGPSNLDHLVAAKHMIFDGGNGRQVRVGGWVDQPTDAARDAWVAKFSDHAWLYTEVQQV